jgi:hypothetical protein
VTAQPREAVSSRGVEERGTAAEPREMSRVGMVEGYSVAEATIKVEIGIYFINGES